MNKIVIPIVAILSAATAFGAGPGGGGTPPGGGGNQPGGGGSTTWTFDTFLATSTTNYSNCITREGMWTGWTPGITTVTLTSSVSNLAVGVCAGCTTLTSVNLSSCTALTEIPDSAFAGCTALKTVTLPSTCTSIGANAFAGCSALTTVTAAGVTIVGHDAFRACSALTAFPPTVTAAGAFSFAQTGVVSVDLSFVSAGAGAFAGCTNLVSATVATSAPLPAAVFAGCTALATADWSEVSEFGQAALAGCDALTTLTLSSSATLGDYALAADAATIVTTLSQSSLPAYADTSFLGREVSYVPVAGSVTRIEAKDLVDWLSDATASAVVTQPADYNTATLKTWLSVSGNAYAYAYADDIATDADFLGLTVKGTSFIYNAPSDAALSVAVAPVASYALSSDDSDWLEENLTWSDADSAYVATDTAQTSCFARLRFTWNW